MPSNSRDFRLRILADTQQVGDKLSGLKTQLTALAAAVGIGLGIKELADVADSYSNLSTRIKITTSETGNFEQAMAGVQQLAIATNSSLDATAQLFTKINDVAKTMGISQDKALSLTKTITQAVQIGGGEAASTEAAIYQFNQALQSGVLRGDEFNSVMEQAPGLSKALANGLGVTTAELRKMAGEGQLTSSTVIKALQNQSKAVQAEFDKFPTTIGNAIQRVVTQWQILIGEFDQANGASKTAATWIVGIADSLDSLKRVLNDVGDGFVWVGDNLANIDPATIEEAKTVVQSLYDTLKNTVATLGDVAVSVGDILNSALSSLFNFSSGIDSANDKTNGFTKLLQALNVVIGFINDGVSGIGIALNLFVGLLYDVSAAFAQLESKLTFGETSKAAVANMDKMAKKAQEYYDKASNGALQFQSKGVQALDEIAKTQQQKDAESAQSSKEKFDAINKQSDENLAKIKANSDEQVRLQKEIDQAKKDGFIGTADAHLQQIKKLEQEETELRNKQKSFTADGLDEAKAYAEAKIKANQGAMDGVMQADLISKGYIVTLNEQGKVSVEAWARDEQGAKNAKLALDNLKQAKVELEEFDKTSAVKRQALNQQIADGQKSGDLTSVVSAQNAIAQIDAEHQKLTDRIKQRQLEVAQGSANVAQVATNNAKTAATALGVDLDVALNKTSTGFNMASSSVSDLSTNLKAMGVTGEQAANVTYQGWQKWLETAKTQAEIDAAKAKLLEFQETGVFSTKQVASGMDAIRIVTQKLPQALTPVEQAFERLGIKTKEQLRLAAQVAIADFKTVAASGQATQDQLKEAAERTMQAAQASGDAVAIAAAKSQASVAGLVTETDKAGKTVVQTTQQYVDSLSKVTDSANQAKGVFASMGDESEDAAERSAKAWEKAGDRIANSQKKPDQADKDFNKTGEGGGYQSGTFNMWTNQAVIESRLKEMGYSDKDAALRAKKIYDSSHFGNGGGARAASLGYQQRKGGGSAFTLDGGFSNQGYVNEQLEIMKNNLGVYKMNEENRAKLAEAQKATNQPTETHKHIFELASKRVEVQVPSHQSHDLNDMLRQLEIAQRSSM